MTNSNITIRPSRYYTYLQLPGVLVGIFVAIFFSLPILFLWNSKSLLMSFIGLLLFIGCITLVVFSICCALYFLTDIGMRRIFITPKTIINNRGFPLLSHSVSLSSIGSFSVIMSSSDRHKATLEAEVNKLGFLARTSWFGALQGCAKHHAVKLFDKHHRPLTTISFYGFEDDALNLFTSTVMKQGKKNNVHTTAV